MLELIGRVDGMPQRFEFGNRLRMTVFRCRVVAAEEDDRADGGDAGDGGYGDGGGGSSSEGGGGSDDGGDCGRLERVQLDWGRQREKNRANAIEEWPRPGQYWRLTARLKRPVAPVNPDAFDLELRYLQQGVGGLGRVEARTRLNTPPAGATWRPWSGLLVRFEAWRAALRDRLEAVHAHRIGTARDGNWSTFGIVVALALGEQGAIGAGLWGLFSRTGVSHLMAISGMHVTMLALVAAWLAARLLGVLARQRFPGVSRMLGAHPRQVLVLLIAVTTAFGYALLSGWGIPSQRTCWMLSAAALMTLLGRGGGSLDVTLLAAAMVVAMDPWAVATAGFWLSFGAVAAILWSSQGVDSRRASSASLGRRGIARLAPALRDAGRSQWAATVGLAPLVVTLFSTLSLIGPLANSLAIPWVSLLVTPLSLAATLLATVSETGGGWLLQLSLWLTSSLIVVLNLLDRLPAASLAIARPGNWTLAAALIGAAVLLAPSGLPMRRAGLLCLMPLLMAPQCLPAPGELWVTVLDIGQGSSILVESGDRRLLFDAGTGEDADNSAAARFLMPYLRSRGIDAIDMLVISHLDREHAGGVASVLQSLRPKQVLSSFDVRLLPVDTQAPAVRRAEPCVAGERHRLGSAMVAALYPRATGVTRQDARDNASSCVVRVSSTAGSVLLAGDLPASAEARLLNATDPAGAALRSDILIVPQSGGGQATGPRLLAAVQPRFAVLQVSYRNRHRHPHPAVLRRLSAIDARILRTDVDGAIQIRLRAGSNPEVRRLRLDSPPYWRIDIRD
ncbi:MAG: DNA internalization-related competence protein ComEC/Rec2 [Lautropia sp.]